MFEIDGYAASNVRLDLAKAPVGAIAVSNELAGFEQGIEVGHGVGPIQGVRRMSMATSEITALLGSRICHDLISPIGAISNGVELLTMSGAASLPEIDLIAQSVEHANARIGFFRVAFGAASDQQRLGEAEIQQILGDLTRGSRLEIRWNLGSDAPRPEVKLAFLVINCLEYAMPRGGTISVTRAGERWEIAAQAERMRIVAPMWEALSRPEAGAGASAAEVQFLLAPLVAKDLGRTVTAELAETAATVWF